MTPHSHQVVISRETMRALYASGAAVQAGSPTQGAAEVAVRDVHGNPLAFRVWLEHETCASISGMQFACETFDEAFLRLVATRHGLQG